MMIEMMDQSVPALNIFENTLFANQQSPDLATTRSSCIGTNHTSLCSPNRLSYICTVLYKLCCNHSGRIRSRCLLLEIAKL